MLQKIYDLFASQGVDKNQLTQIVRGANGSPMMILAGVQSLGLAPQVMQTIGQELMMLMMSNPTALQELIAELGVSPEDAQNALKNIQH